MTLECDGRGQLFEMLRRQNIGGKTRRVGANDPEREAAEARQFLDRALQSWNAPALLPSAACAKPALWSHLRWINRFGTRALLAK